MNRATVLVAVWLAAVAVLPPAMAQQDDAAPATPKPAQQAEPANSDTDQNAVPIGPRPRTPVPDGPKVSPFGGRRNPSGGARPPAAAAGTALVIAAEEGNLDRVKELLAAGANIDAVRRGSNDTALIAALAKNKTDVAEYLLDQGANPNLKDRAKGTALQWAAYWGNAALVTRLIEMGGDVNNINNENRSPIHYATRRGHVDVVRTLIEHGANVNRTSGFGNAPIDLALLHSRPDLAKLLIESNARLLGTRAESVARVKAASEKNWGLVLDAMFAEAKRDPALLQRLQDVAFEAALGTKNETLLVSLGARGSGVSARTIAGFTRLFQACAVGNEALARELLDKGANVNEPMQPSGWTPLHAATLAGHFNVVGLLLNHDADPNAADGLGRTPLHLAATQNRPGLLAALLKANADPARADFSGATPLHYAAISGRQSIVEALVKHGAPLNSRDSDGLTPFDFAVRNGHDEATKLLSLPAHIEPPLPEGFDLLARATAVYQTPAGIEMQRQILAPEVRDGVPLVHLAIMYESPTAISELIGQFPDTVAQRDRYGYLPLHLAAGTPTLGDLSSLLAATRDVNDAENLAQWTPLHCAAAAGNEAAVRALLDKGAKRKPMDALGQTPADVARLAGHARTAALLR